MRNSSKAEITNSPANQVFGVDFSDCMQKQSDVANMEVAQEFGMSLRSVKELKRRIERN